MVVDIYWNAPHHQGFNEQEKQHIFDMWFQYPAMKNCPWYKTMPMTLFNEINPSNKVTDYITNMSMHNADPRVIPATIKLCPSVQDVLRKSVVMKAPCDFGFIIGEDGRYAFHSSDENLVSKVEMHSEWQFKNCNSSVLQDKLNLKIDTGMYFSAPSNINMFFLSPDFHGETPLKILNAGFTGDYTSRMSIQVQSFIDKNIRELNIKKDTALAYMYFSDRINFVYDEDLFYVDKRNSLFSGNKPYPYKSKKGNTLVKSIRQLFK